MGYKGTTVNNVSQTADFDKSHATFIRLSMTQTRPEEREHTHWTEDANGSDKSTVMIQPRLCRLFRNIIIFYGEEMLAPRSNSKLEPHPLSAVRDCLFNVFADTLHNWRPFVHPKPEDAPCRGNRDPLNLP
jgi:hypothetical protein